MVHQDYFGKDGGRNPHNSDSKGLMIAVSSL